MRSWGLGSYRRHDKELEQENFWPSFADIMMVIVMIFLMVMVVLLVKNWELVTQLKQSILAEQQIAEEAEKKASENVLLSDRLADAESLVSRLRLQLMQAQDENGELRVQLDEKSEEIRIFENTLAENSQTIKDLEGREVELKAMLAEEKKSAEDKAQAIMQLQANARAAQDEFDVLKKKYDKLVRPARTPKGKTVVEVSYTKEAGRNVIRLKEPGKPLREVNSDEMHQTLARIQKIDPSKLYLKIVFPKGSQISHDEAWRFTSGLLDRYDYYYQD
ncbi:hypothetical protein [Pseudobacteriovorax antillogorgiicola]|uniref:Uncharacterized protein n=1 Tax=Pseudobacteriovorax antillogorgiicola TaxID=1513793 RepID=A0A1Y6BZ88_9BACT|nr:hypothetical protein [Pseudobacteriovorax antillogorgiicola]TCS53111.1 hypothetical protein EDD56_108162 [Pseudobacteriovorax antillogorgiicola]SMF25615.1 hypothetical protein SAMN06296036_10884 [Pseudobacteriovorax antillogorgiicola]